MRTGQSKFGYPSGLLSRGKTVTASAASSGSYADDPVFVNGTSKSYDFMVSFGHDRATTFGGDWQYVGWLAGTNFTAGSGFWLKVDLESAARVVECSAFGIINSSNGILSPEEYTVEYSLDNSTWGTFGSALTGLSVGSGNQRWRLTANDIKVARYLRFTFDHNTSGRWIFISELEVWGG